MVGAGQSLSEIYCVLKKKLLLSESRKDLIMGTFNFNTKGTEQWLKN